MLRLARHTDQHTPALARRQPVESDPLARRVYYLLAIRRQPKRIGDRGLRAGGRYGSLKIDVVSDQRQHAAGNANGARPSTLGARTRKIEGNRA